MKNIITTALIFILAQNLFAQKNEVHFYVNNSTSGRIDNYATVGFGYYHQIIPKFLVGLTFETPLEQNKNNYNFQISDGIKSLNFEYTDKIKLTNVDLLLKYELLKKEVYTINFIGGLTYQSYNITNIPLIEIHDLQITNATEVNTNKNFVLPKFGINADLRLYKSINLSGLLFNRNTSFLSSKEIYSNRSILTTANNSSSGSGLSMFTIEEQLGFNIGLSYKF